MCEFIKQGNDIIVKPKGSDYTLEGGKQYKITYSRFSGIACTLQGDFTLPNKLYTNKKEDSFIKRILTHYTNTDTATTGVLLCGTKGAGKTITAKRIAKESNLPIIIVDATVPAEALSAWFEKFDQEICIFFDEVEKNFAPGALLSLLDGVVQTGKKLVLFTANEYDKISQYMKDRCSRIRYLRKYDKDSNKEFIKQIVEDIGVKNQDDVISFCENNIVLPSIDNIKAFVNEVKELEDETTDLNEIAEILNIQTTYKQTTQKKEAPSYEPQEPIAIADAYYDDEPICEY